MQFAAPWGLLALLSLPVILALHILRPRRRSVAVASIALWVDAMSERQRGIGWQRLLRSLSLILLLLAALAASLALGDPRWVTPARESSDTVMIVDTSASMSARSDGGTRLDAAIEHAAGRIDALPEGGRLLIMSSARRAVLHTGFESSRDTLYQALRGIRATDEAGRPADAVTLALSLLRDREAGQVVFITDGAFDADRVPVSPQLAWTMVGEPAANAAITRFDFRREPGDAERFQVLLTLRNYTSEPVTLPVNVALERRTLLNLEVVLPANAEQTLVRAFRGKALGRARASIGRDDALAADNRAQAVINVPEPLRVLLASPGNFFLDSVLAAAPGWDVTRRDTLDADTLPRLALAYDVVIADRVALPQLPPGNFLLIDTLAPALPLRTAGRIASPAITGQGRSALIEGIDLASVRVDEARRLEPLAAAAGLQRLLWSEQTDLAVALLEDRRRILYLGFDLARSNFPLQTAFPVFIRQGIDWLAGGPGRGAGREPTAFSAGERVLLRGPATQRDVLLRRPDGEGISLLLDDGVTAVEDTSRSGLYRYDIGQVTRHFAVNLADAAESDLRRRADTDAPPPATTRAAAAVRSTPLWPAFVVAMLALLALEWILRSSGRRRA